MKPTETPSPETGSVTPAPVVDVNRRNFLRLAGLGLAASYTVLPLDFAIVRAEAQVNPDTVFPQSVSSGDPTPSGFILWTRIAPTAVVAGTNLLIEIATDSAFAHIVLKARISSTQIKASLDYTVRADLDGLLHANSVYYYRFHYNGVYSRTGRGRTLPKSADALASVKFAVLNCHDYTNGYYAAFNYIAEDDTIDFCIHVGDYIYETVGGTSFQPGPYPGRNIDLPLDTTKTLKVVQGLVDYRKLYQTYHSEPFLRAARENHTWIFIWDDHEMANDNYHDYPNDSQGAPDHPFTLDPTTSAATKVTKLRQLKFDSQQAWFEYTPTRVGIKLNSSEIFDRISIYRKFKFGTLLELFMTDERTYRSPHPEGEVQFTQRYIAPMTASQMASTQTMLGATQLDWFVHGVTTSTALWKAWGNEVQLSPFNVALNDALAGAVNLFLGTTFYTPGYYSFDNDAWDGYQHERGYIAQQLQTAGVKNFVVLSGDFHSYYASFFKVNYRSPVNDSTNVVGVEYMAPPPTSANLAEQLNNPQFTGLITQMATNPQLNPHAVFFNSAHFGYATVEFNTQYCEYVMYVVDKTVNSAAATRTVLKKFQTPVNTVEIHDIP